MGRHRAAAPTGTSPTSPLVVGGVALIVVALLLFGFVAWRSGDDPPPSDSAVLGTPANTTSGATGSTEPSTGDASTAASTPASPAPAPRTTEPPADPPTLAFQVVGRSSYLTVRVPGGPTLASRTFRKGERGSSDRAVLEVVVGNSAAVRFTLNGQPRRPGAVGQVEKFTVRRR